MRDSTGRSGVALMVLLLPCVSTMVVAASPLELRGSDRPHEEEERKTPPGTVFLPAVPHQPIGLDEATMRHFLKDAIPPELARDSSWRSSLWDRVMLFSTPAHEASTPALYFGVHEVSSAQWDVFEQSSWNNARTFTTSAEVRTIRDIAVSAWRLDTKRDARAIDLACEYLAEMNAGLRSERGEPLDDTARAERTSPGDVLLPLGIDVKCPRVPPRALWGQDRVSDTGDRSLPVQHVSWCDVMAFCAWSGLHLPLEVEWERAARGPAGRLFAWGDAWSPLACVWRSTPTLMREDHNESVSPRTTPKQHEVGPWRVNSIMTPSHPDGIFHLTGNVSEWVMDRAYRYAGSSSEFKFDGIAMLARGGNYGDSAETHLAADRIWDLPWGFLRPDTRVPGFGFRYAAYPHHGADLTVPALVGLAEIRRQSAPRSRAIVGADALLSTRDRIQRTAGVIDRDLIEPQAPGFAFVRGPATGIALFPVDELPKREERDSAGTQVRQLLGLLVSTPNVVIEGVSTEGAPVDVRLGGGEDFELTDRMWRQIRHRVGATVALDGNRVVVGPAAWLLLSSSELQRRSPIAYLPDSASIDYEVADRCGDGSGVEVGDAVELTTIVPTRDRSRGSGVEWNARITVIVRMRTE